MAARSAPGANVRFEQADLFSWRPVRRYDAVFFGFFLSHVPEERFAGFWALVADALVPGGRVVFVDDHGPFFWGVGAQAVQISPS